MKILIVSEDKPFLKHAGSIFAGTGHDVTTTPGTAADLRTLVKSLGPDLLLLDGRDDVMLDLAGIERTTLQCPGVAILLLTTMRTPAFLIDAMRAGVREVLPSLHPGELLAAVERAAAKLTASWTASHGKVHAFVGTSGGSGTTFLATNFGYQLAQTHKVLLVDLNLQFGDALSFLQDAKATTTIADLARDINRLDAPLLQASAIKVTPTYSILAAPEEPGQATDITPEHIDAILRLAVTQYDFVLLDMPRIVDAMMMTALDQASTIFLVLQASVPHLRNADRLLSVFRSLDYANDKIELLLNRYDKRDDITIDRIRRTLGAHQIHMIANGWRQVSTAINQGVPLVQVERKHGVIRSLSELGDTMVPVLDPHVGLFDRLFRRA
ncbi:AAA family ATPase [Telluria mixta]|uniref:AAA family ATPase n=1 Tax=Telluria mixta TaxID=34071 RepID=A0ABT2BSC1_9BURK|nr:AAA family ATPase [Telluria mixta]MCS0628020.1 AAA family ATPase [Telluria mixta]WEM93863.1 AAA family ATPase [Telluria mixta]